MILNELSCDRPEFRPVSFNRKGLTLIIGDRLDSSSEDGSSNGVGKTLSLALVNHCLGASSDKKLASSVPDWVFRLDFSLGSDSHVIHRTGDGKYIWLDEQPIKIGRLRAWLNEKGPFSLPESVEGLTFRSLFPRFARLRVKDCEHPVELSYETPYYALLRTAFMLGIDLSLIVEKCRNKVELDQLDNSIENWKSDELLHATFRAGTKPKVRAEWLEGEIERLSSDLRSFRVSAEYRDVESEANDLTAKMRNLEVELEVVKFQINGIDEALSEKPDIGKDDLLSLYKGLEGIFKEEALRHFSDVEEFHRKLLSNRERRLTQERINLVAKLEDLHDELREVSRNRDDLLESLHDKRALDEYASLARRHAQLKEERQRLEEYLTYTEKLQERIQRVREKLVRHDREAADYVKSQPLDQKSRRFQEIISKLYPDVPAGILLENNTGKNKTRYDLSVNVQGDDSDGINAARIISFDWILLLEGANHLMNFLWHDNRLFAHIDPLQRARWFRFVFGDLANTGKQYIATLNTENYEAMLAHLNDTEREDLSNSVVLTLRGDEPKNKLMGIQFGSDD